VDVGKRTNVDLNFGVIKNGDENIAANIAAATVRLINKTLFCHKKTIKFVELKLSESLICVAIVQFLYLNNAGANVGILCTT
jgi:hypothetical protein